VGISRSALIERFSRYLSEPPMAISPGGGCSWRRSRSRKRRAAWPTLPTDIGYESEAAFSRCVQARVRPAAGRYRSDHKECAAARPRHGQLRQLVGAVEANQARRSRALVI
jgi:hypothetical protein